MIPASPLVEDHAVPLTELYVQPPISALIIPFAFGQKPDMTPVSSYRKLFLSDKDVPYKNIYVEANAGYGKTSFTQRVALAWCQAQTTNKSLKSKFRQEDVDTLKRFDFLFLLHLRDFQGEDTCSIEDLILKFVSMNFPDKEQFSKQFIVRMLQTKTCLVIIDGLDEWVHPETCTLTPGIPHNNYRQNCTVLTTTRPWKLSTIELQPNLIDRHLVISELDDETSNKLESNAVKLLRKTSGENDRDLKDFDTKLSSVKLDNIRLIPYILLQLICIWFDGLSIGKSKCETYSNIIEFTLDRGLKKKNAPILPTRNTERNVTVPGCMRHKAFCNKYLNVLLKSGELAFYTLFQKIKEFSFGIERTTVLKFLTVQELEFFLRIGMLSQTKDNSKVSEKRYKVFFQHKTVLEFLAALYITSKWNDTTVKPIILKDCTSLSSILEMDNLFVFVCGMNPVVYTCIAVELQKIVNLDNGDRRKMESYQSMQLQCFQESMANENPSCSIPLHDILLGDKMLTKGDLTALITIIAFYKGDVKSLVHPSTGDETLTALRGLKSLHLYTVHMTHSNLERLYAVISQTTTLTQLKLQYVHCSDHKFLYCDCDVTLNLHGLKELKTLYLSPVPCKELHVSPACLKELRFLLPPQGEKMNASASAALWQDLGEALVLSSLTLHRMTFCQEMIQTIPTLTQLQYLELRCIELGDAIPRFSPVMTKLTRVELSLVTMSSAAWRELFLSVGQLPQSITVKLLSITMPFQEWRELLISVGGLTNTVTVKVKECNGPSREEWQTIENLIKSMPTLSQLPDSSIDEYGIANLTVNNKPVL